MPCGTPACNSRGPGEREAHFPKQRLVIGHSEIQKGTGASIPFLPIQPEARNVGIHTKLSCVANEITSDAQGTRNLDRFLQFAG